MTRQAGFSLVELAMVLLIISLLLGGLLVPLATQLEARQRNDAQEQLERIREALIGFAMVNGRLPCYTTTADPTSANYGVEDAVCNPGGLTTDGILPWKTLGLNNGLDPWGVQRTATTDPWLGYWRYRVHSNFSSATPFTLTSDPTSSNRLCVQDASANLLVSTSETPVAIVYSTGADRAASGQNASYEATSTSTNCVDNTPILYQGGPVSGTFDDITIWLTRPLLFNRMVTAGRLP
jgi:prepilin-type N-terminal cleavage/methylation domain-containing protein